ncbi:DUF3987 domain-containing protein [Sinomicrobium kalidii]|uniref:DUF3987 domain-containing protein n=1 Tax=Sinomicrobium kalidii TaxID=2900738 RepID=UPI001E5C80AB|nr:DUF3987 domain-containing protein [Sinomicrobium kalidii]UGU14256.1 DUF3987 domain-containing protein [Sinomicrobium kalidii]
MNQEKKEAEARFGGSPSLAKTASKKDLIPKTVYQNLPEPLREITEAFQDREKDIILLSSIGVISACLPNVFGMYDHRTYNPNLYVFIIAPPASGKGVMNWAKKLVEPIHEDIVRESKRKIAEYRNASNNEGLEEPKLQIKLVPGNTSSAKFYTHLERAEDDLIIFESEADTLSNMLKQDWGNFSDLLRKGFHHETVSISRATEDRYFEIKRPNISIVISGTPGQVRPLVESKENGLFSRFIFYYFDEVSGWKDVSPRANRVSHDELMNAKGREIKELYQRLKGLKKVEIRMANAQWNIFQGRMSLTNDLILKTGKTDFIPIIRRLGVIAFRLICVLTILEKKDKLIEDEIILYANDKEVKVALEIVKVLVDHSLNVFDKFEKDAISMSMQERSLISKLPSEFRRSQGLEAAQTIGIPERTFDEILKNWRRKKIVRKVSHGNYEKIIVK